MSQSVYTRFVAGFKSEIGALPHVRIFRKSILDIKRNKVTAPVSKIIPLKQVGLWGVNSRELSLK